MKAVYNGQVLAESDKDNLIFIEGKWYFPPGSVNKKYLKESDTQYHCFWKGDCKYFDVAVDGKVSKDGAFIYPEPYDSAIDKVKKDFSGYFAFWNGVEVKEEQLV